MKSADLVMEKKESTQVEDENPRFRENDNGEVEYLYRKRWSTVTVKRCFPWSREGGQFISIRRSDEELLLLESFEGLSEESQRVLKKALGESIFCFQVTDVLKVIEEFELRQWIVMTVQGRRQFQTKLTHWPQSTTEGEVLIQDLHGDLYQINDVKKLSEKAQKLLWAFTD